jgi:hypothetical protein
VIALSRFAVQHFFRRTTSVCCCLVLAVVHRNCVMIIDREGAYYRLLKSACPSSVSLMTWSVIVRLHAHTHTHAHTHAHYCTSALPTPVASMRSLSVPSAVACR